MKSVGLDKSVGVKLKNLRKVKGLSAEDLAEKMNCSACTIYRYENGYKYLKYNTFLKACMCLGVEPEDIIEDEKFSLRFRIQEYQDIRDIIHFFRLKNNISIQYLADALGIDDSLVYQWEARERTISPKHFKKIFELLEFD